MLGGCTSATEAQPRAGEQCGETIRTDALPEWARAGFSWDGSGTKHVYSAEGDILAILFGHPLSSPSAPDRSNKILWVARDQYEHGDLRIDAELAGTTTRAEAKVAGGPGPSIIDLPRPGCWHVTLTWPGHTDSMDLTYGAPSP
ncbi:hypothetical protein Aab01nite_51830 [Paractinoplanes abujensis]|nr:hypothetical protein Aab01nite_51830 [Actinoplanes abujensis]